MKVRIRSLQFLRMRLGMRHLNNVGSSPVYGALGSLLSPTIRKSSGRVADLYGQSDARFTSNPCSLNDLSARAQIGPYKSF